MADNKFRYTNEKCLVCNENFKPDDDIVVCPDCGTPHHRECYKANSKCANHERHSESYKWDSAFVYEEDIEPSVYTEENKSPYIQPIDTSKLPFGMPVSSFQINPLNEFPQEIKDGIKTEDTAIFVRQDALKYIGKFYKVKDGKTTWNWAAFFFAPYWFFYRKLYKIGIVFLAVFVLLSSLSFLPPAARFSNAVYDLEVKLEEITRTIETEEEYQAAIMELSNEMSEAFRENKTGITIAAFQSVASFFISVFIGLNANKWYYRHTMSQIKSITAENKADEYKEQLLVRGGTAYGAAFLCVLAEKTLFMALEMLLSVII